MDIHNYIIVCVYVDDMIIIDSTVPLIKDMKIMLAWTFDMKDLDITHVILAVKIT